MHLLSFIFLWHVGGIMLFGVEWCWTIRCLGRLEMRTAEPRQEGRRVYEQRLVGVTQSRIMR